MEYKRNRITDTLKLAVSLVNNCRTVNGMRLTVTMDGNDPSSYITLDFWDDRFQTTNDPLPLLCETTPNTKCVAHDFRSGNDYEFSDYLDTVTWLANIMELCVSVKTGLL